MTCPSRFAATWGPSHLHQVASHRSLGANPPRQISKTHHPKPRGIAGMPGPLLRIFVRVPNISLSLSRSLTPFSTDSAQPPLDSRFGNHVAKRSMKAARSGGASSGSLGPKPNTREQCAMPCKESGLTRHHFPSSDKPAISVRHRGKKIQHMRQHRVKCRRLMKLGTLASLLPYCSMS